MESLAALGLAAAVVQFVDFTKDLILDSRDIYRSGKGALDDNLQLEQICEVLKRLSGELIAKEDALILSGGSEYHLVPEKDALGLKNLALSCRNDCDELLSIMRKLSIDNGANRRWKSIKASFRYLQHKGQINGLEDRIAKAQNIMTLHMQSVIRDQISSLSMVAASLKQGNEAFQLSQDEKMDIITRNIHYLSLHADHECFSSSDIEQTGNRLSECLPLQDELARLQRILSSLQFDTRPVRHSSIPEANVATFRWIFKSKFSNWLRNEGGIFWISGKAGSGKSTMMKFVADHEITNQLVNEWAGPNPVVIACHYFWNPGTEMQRSQQGLLQTLLFEIFRQCPSIVPLVCPKRWEMARRVGRQQDPAIPRRRAMDFDASWTIPELYACLKDISGQNDSAVRFCLFIDGLDEFSGDYVDLCQALKSLSESRLIKLCVSSRPWNVFQDFFGQNPNTTLSIHDLTREDIRKFAHNRLEAHPRWNSCCMSEEQQRQLIQEIAERAEGVFLWAFLVTQSLRKGLSDDDTIMDLQQRLRSLPTDLERLFKNLLNGVDPVYHEYMAGIIRIAQTAKSPLNLRLYYHHEKQSESGDYAYSEIQRLRLDEYSRALDLTCRRINSKTRGLLEVVSSLESTKTVQFLHRTVRDFLRTREMDDFLVEKSRDNFDPALEICMALLAWIKYQLKTHIWGQNGDFLNMVELHDILRYASEVTAERVDTLVKVLDDLERNVAELSPRLLANDLRIAFRQLAIRYNLFRYVSAKISLNPTHFDEAIAQIPALHHPETRDPSSPSNDGGYLPVECITVLLEHDHDPNKVLTLWSKLFSLYFRSRRDANYFTTSGLLQVFLQHGANPNANVGENDARVSAFALFLLGCFDASFESTASTSTTTSYLNILQDFFDFGADLDYEFHSSSTLWSFGLSIKKDFTQGSICEAFSLCLKARAGQWIQLTENDQIERHFFYSVTKKVLSQGVLRNFDISMLIGVIPVVFPEDLAEQLIAIVPKIRGSRNRRKRDEYGRDPAVKRRRTRRDHKYKPET
ncbi:hypothetical protein F4680DRAFT_439415 [Xylaria scruposa]|nr:hypothetical protein F4680DRAFT_439415 [Xylaria scruposa]